MAFLFLPQVSCLSWRDRENFGLISVLPRVNDQLAWQLGADLGRHCCCKVKLAHCAASCSDRILRVIYI